MKIAGFQKVSLVDFPGKVASVVFTPGCNMDCYYCHNRVLLGPEASRELVDPDEILGYLCKRVRVLDGVVVSRGEPTLQPGLSHFLQRIRDLDLHIKLDTNGTRPEVLEELIGEELVDFVAMDLKAPGPRYEEICGTRVDLKAVESSRALLLKGRVPYEFRTTLSPLLDEADVMHMAREIPGAQRLVLQQFRRPEAVSPRTDVRLAIPSHSPDYLNHIASRVQDLAIPCHTRGL